MNKLLNIVVIGIGGGGSNMVNHLLSHYYSDNISYFIANTDKQALIERKNLEVIQLGVETSKGLGAGMKPEIGLASAMENQDEIAGVFFEADLVFISVGMGGGTGTGAAPYIAKIAKQAGALTIGITTMPFKFEGKKRSKLANVGLKNFKENCDSIITIENENLLSLIDKRSGMRESFMKVDSILSEAVIGTSGVILSSGSNDINLDFADLKTIMEHGGDSIMGIGYSENSAKEALSEALSSPLLRKDSVESAMGVLIHFEVNSDYSFIDLSMSIEDFQENMDSEANIIFGTTTNNELLSGEIKVTIIATLSNVELNVIDTKPLKMEQLRIERKSIPLGGDLDSPSYLRYG